MDPIAIRFNDGVKARIYGRLIYNLTDEAVEEYKGFNNSDFNLLFVKNVLWHVFNTTSVYYSADSAYENRSEYIQFTFDRIITAMDSSLKLKVVNLDVNRIEFSAFFEKIKLRAKISEEEAKKGKAELERMNLELKMSKTMTDLAIQNGKRMKLEELAIGES